MKQTRLKRKGKKDPVRRELDRIVRELVFERDGHKCVRCSAKGGLTPSHCFPKGRYAALRWELDNILTLCVACHLYWWHTEPLFSAEWFRKNWPERHAKLMVMANSGFKVKPKELLQEYKERA